MPARAPPDLELAPMPEHRLPEPDRPWVMRTYAGHSNARESNELYRKNLEKGQTGLAVAFDLPTQTGYDPDQELSRGEVGKVGVSIAHKRDMHTLLDGIPPEPSMRLIADMIACTVDEVPKWNPINICSYHLQEDEAETVQLFANTLS